MLGWFIPVDAMSGSSPFFVRVPAANRSALRASQCGDETQNRIEYFLLHGKPGSCRGGFLTFE